VRVVGRDVKEGSRGGECQQRVVSHSTFWLGKVEVRFSYWLKSKRRSFDDDEVSFCCLLADGTLSISILFLCHFPSL
jgi:hypothetical protein